MPVRCLRFLSGQVQFTSFSFRGLKSAFEVGQIIAEPDTPNPVEKDEQAPNLISWRLTTTMAASDVTGTLEDALTVTGLQKARVRHKPRLLLDNGPCYISGELKSWLKQQDIEHTRGAPYHPTTQGKIERYHRSMKNVVKLEHYYFPRELEKAIGEWMHHYNHERYHESLDNVTPADVYEGRRNTILDQRALVKARTMTKSVMRQRRRH